MTIKLKPMPPHSTGEHVYNLIDLHMAEKDCTSFAQILQTHGCIAYIKANAPHCTTSQCIIRQPVAVKRIPYAWNSVR
jgi:hypothetical protein